MYIHIVYHAYMCLPVYPAPLAAPSTASGPASEASRPAATQAPMLITNITLLVTTIIIIIMIIISSSSSSSSTSSSSSSSTGSSLSSRVSFGSPKP